MGTATVAVSGFKNTLLGQKASTILNFPISSAKKANLEKKRKQITRYQKLSGSLPKHNLYWKIEPLSTFVNKTVC